MGRYFNMRLIAHTLAKNKVPAYKIRKYLIQEFGYPIETATIVWWLYQDGFINYKK